MSDTAKTNRKYSKKVSFLKKEITRLLTKGKMEKIRKNPYLYLWFSVLLRAIDDLRYDKWRKDALDWIFSTDYSINDTASFEWVCSILDLNPERVRRMIIRILLDKRNNRKEERKCQYIM